VPCTATHGLAALNMAVNPQFPEGARGQGVSWMSDNGCQPPSLAFMEACSTLEIHQAFTRDNNPKGHAATERVIRTLQEEGRWLQEWTCPLALARALKTWSDDDNEHDLHSALGYKTPRQIERAYHTSHGTQFTAA
jgi:putative transposase